MPGTGEVLVHIDASRKDRLKLGLSGKFDVAALLGDADDVPSELASAELQEVSLATIFIHTTKCTARRMSIHTSAHMLRRMCMHVSKHMSMPQVSLVTTADTWTFVAKAKISKLSLSHNVLITKFDATLTVMSLLSRY